MREEYQRIQVAATDGRDVEDRETGAMRPRSREEIDRDVRDSIREYRRVARMWGVRL
jgi:hypothetical protein